MPRPLREQVADGVYHVYARGNNREPIFPDDVDRHIYLALLRRVVQRRRWRLLAYCLMRNHVHLAFETPEPDIAAGMQWLHGLYGRMINCRYDRTDHVFGDRYGSVLVTSDAQVLAVASYVALNPVKAKLCVRAEDYPWSSYGRVLRGTAPDFVDEKRLLSYLAASGGDPRRRYRELVSPRSSP